AHRRAPALASGMRARERPGRWDVRDNPELPHHHAGRLGAECRRLPRPLGETGAVPDQGPRPARDRALVARRVLEGEHTGRGLSLVTTKRTIIIMNRVMKSNEAKGKMVAVL